MRRSRPPVPAPVLARDERRRRARRWTALVFALALAARVTVLLELRGSELNALLFGDDAWFFAEARRLASGSGQAPHVFYHAPLYTWFLAALLRVAGPDPEAVRWVQACLGAGSAALVCVLGRRAFGLRTGVVAGVLFALHAPAIYFDGLVKKTGLGVFLLLLCLVLLVPERSAARGRGNGPGPWRALLAGLAFGLLCLCRENARVLFVAWLPWVLLGSRSRRARALRWAPAGAFVLGTALLLGSVGLRNALVAGELVFGTTNFGPNLYIGNGSAADGRVAPLRAGRGHPGYDRIDAEELAEAELGRELSAREVSGYWARRALAEVVRDPLRWLGLLLRKTYYLAHDHEWIDLEAYAVYRSESGLLRWLGTLLRFGVLLPLAAAGLVLSWGAGRRVRFLGTCLLLLAASIVLFFVVGRFRMVLVPLLALFAARALVLARHGLRRRPQRRALALLVAFGVALLSRGPIPQDEAPFASVYTGLGLAYEEAGDPVRAERAYRRAAQDRPDHAAARWNLGRALLAREELEPAVEQMRAAVALDPSFAPDLEMELGVALARLGRLDAARERMLAARALTPGDPDVHYNLGLVERQRGELAAAEAAYREALRIRPSHARAANNLGWLLAAQGRRAEAAEMYRRALRADPELEEARVNLERLLAPDEASRAPADARE